MFRTSFDFTSRTLDALFWIMQVVFIHKFT